MRDEVRDLQPDRVSVDHWVIGLRSGSDPYEDRLRGYRGGGAHGRRSTRSHMVVSPPAPCLWLHLARQQDHRGGHRRGERSLQPLMPRCTDRNGSLPRGRAVAHLAARFWSQPRLHVRRAAVQLLHVPARPGRLGLPLQQRQLLTTWLSVR